MVMYVSWFIFYFFSEAKPVLLQNANFDITAYSFEFFLGFSYLVKSSPHCSGESFRFYCDLVFLCLRGLTFSAV